VRATAFAIAGGAGVILSVLWHPAFERELKLLGLVALLGAALQILPKVL
jgi:hypothetical protein